MGQEKGKQSWSRAGGSLGPKSVQEGKYWLLSQHVAQIHPPPPHPCMSCSNVTCFSDCLKSNHGLVLFSVAGLMCVHAYFLLLMMTYYDSYNYNIKYLNCP